MYMCQDTMGKTLGGVFFSLLVITGNFFALNLVLVVLNSAFEAKARKRKTPCSATEITLYRVKALHLSSRKRHGSAVPEALLSVV